MTPRRTTDGSEAADSDLAARIQCGDAAALEALYERHGPAAYGLASRILGAPEEAEAVVQAVFLRVWRQGVPADETRESVRAWLLARVHAIAINAVRRHHAERRQPVAGGAIMPDDRVAREDARSGDREEQVRVALAHLPPDQRRAVALAYYGAYTHGEIDRLLGLPTGTAKNLLRHALQTVRASMRA